MTAADAPRDGPLSRFRLRQVASTIRSGGIIAYPTEAVWGLGCDPLNPDAVYRLLAIKRRPADKGLILIAADQAQLSPFVLPPDPGIQRRLDDSWPGPVTWLLPTRPGTPNWLRGRHDSLAVRVTAHPLAAQLCRAFGGPLVSTSANAAGRPPARTALQVRLRCPDIDLVVSGMTGGQRRPSEIRDARSGAVLRSG